MITKPNYLIRVCSDIVIVNVVLLFTFMLRYAWQITYEADPAVQPGSVLSEYVYNFLAASLIITPLLVVSLGVSGCYTYVHSYQTKFKAIVVAQAVTFVFVLAGMIDLLTPFAMPRSVLVMAGALSVLAFLASRLWAAAWRAVLRVEEHALADPDNAAPKGGPRRTVLVIGGAGYIGSALLPRLLADGFRVRVLDLLLYGTEPIAKVLGDPALEIIRADFRRVDPLVKAMRGVESVIHLGGIVGDPACAVDEELTIDVNLAATRLIAEVAKGSGVKRLIFASTCSVYGAGEQVLDENSELNPLSLYARSKIASEKILVEMADESFAPIIARFGTIYGISGRTRFDLVVNLLTAKAVFDREITVFGGDQWRPFLHVDDAARAVHTLLRLPTRHGAEIFNVGANQENYTIRQLGEIIKRLVPEAELRCSGDDQDKRNYRVSFGKIARVAGFKTRWTVEDGVRQVVAAIAAGSIDDYQDVQYSNVKSMAEFKNNGLAPPRVRWAHDLISAGPTSAAV